MAGLMVADQTTFEAQRAANLEAASRVTVGDIVRVKVSRSLMQAKAWKTRTVEGPVVRVTDKAIQVECSVTTIESDHCHRCGKDLSRFGSRLIGYGPDCAEYLGIHWPSTSELSDEEVNEIRERIYTANVPVTEWLPKWCHITVIGKVAPVVTPPAPVVTPPAIVTPPAPVVTPAAPADVRLTVEELNTTAHQGTFIVCRSPYSAENYARCKSVMGGRWDKEVPPVAPTTRPGAWVWAVSGGTAGQLKAAWAGKVRRGNAAFVALVPSAETTAKIAAAVEAKTSTALADIPGLNGSSWLHQRQAFWFASALDAVALDMGMGTGKSRVAVGLVEHRQHKRVLIVAPKRVVETVWADQFGKHAARPYAICRLMKGTAKDKAVEAQRAMELAAKLNMPFVCLINYQSVYREGFDRWVLKAGFDCVIFDEVHKIKAPGGKAAMFCARLAKNIKHKIGLTGTLTPHSRLDLYSIFRALDPSIFGTSFAAFRNRYANMHPVFPGQVVSWKPENETEMQTKVASIAYRVTSDILDLPDITHNEIAVTIGTAAMRAYKRMADDMVTAWGEGEVTATNALTKLLRLQQIACGYLKTDEGEEIEIDTAKAEALEDLLDGLSGTEPVVVFYRFHHDAQNIRKVVASLGRRYAELSGRKLGRDEAGLAEWLAGEADVIAVQIQSGEAGIDLTRAHYCVYYSLDFNLGNYDQSLARVHRPGQTQPVSYYHIVAANTVDQKIYEALEARKSDVTAFLSSIMADLGGASD